MFDQSGPLGNIDSPYIRSYDEVGSDKHLGNIVTYICTTDDADLSLVLDYVVDSPRLCHFQYAPGTKLTGLMTSILNSICLVAITSFFWDGTSLRCSRYCLNNV